jgi:hypothetical protein
MNITFSEQIKGPVIYILLFAVCLLFSCQSNTENTAATSQVEVTDTVAAADTAAARPAPSFFVIPPDMAKSRVWICIEASSDIFHVKHDCPVLKQCKGTFRNLTLTRAIEDFGRYNCQECSKDYDHIFDEQRVR